MGFEQIINWASGYKIQPTVVKDYHSDRRVHWNKKLLGKSRFGHEFDKKTLKNIDSEKLSYFNHKFAISKQSFDEQELLKRDLMSIGLTYSKKGVEFVSIVEGTKYPIFGTQFHPEKVQFEQNDSNGEMNTGKKAVDAVLKFGMIFKNEAMKNSQKFGCKKLHLDL